MAEATRNSRDRLSLVERFVRFVVVLVLFAGCCMPQAASGCQLSIFLALNLWSRSTKSSLDNFSSEDWSIVDELMANPEDVTPVIATANLGASAATAAAPHLSPVAEENLDDSCSTEYDATWLASANLTQLFQQQSGQLRESGICVYFK